MYKLQAILVCSFFSLVKNPKIGLVLSLGILIYTFWVDPYRDLHVSSMRVAVLTGQVWLFACAVEVEDDGEIGSYMLWGWVPFVILGYSFLWIKSIAVSRSALSIERK